MSAIDLASKSIKKRYGFICIDCDNRCNGSLNPYPKDSLAWYKKVITSNGKDLD